MTATVRTTHLQVRIDGVLDTSAYAASVSLGFDQRYAEATVRRTGGGSVAIAYWSAVEIHMGTTPGAGAAVRFRGSVLPVENALYPIENVLRCKGRLYRAAFVKNNRPGGTDFVTGEEPTPAEGGIADEEMVKAVLTACAVPYTATNIGGTGKGLGSVYLDLRRLQQALPGPFTWAEQQSGLDFIEALDEVSVPDDASGRFRTFESLGGEVFRTKLATVPAAGADFAFTEGEDVLEARIGRDPAGSANRARVTGAPDPVHLEVESGGLEPQFTAQTHFTAASAFAPYLPPGLPAGPEGFPTVTVTLSSPLIEKSENAHEGTVLSCEAVAQFLLAEHNTVLDTLDFSTPRDDLLGPGQTVHLHAPRLGLTDAARHYWLQHLEVTVDERGAFTQRLRCLRRS
jgi:hypothetical protein